MAAAGAVSAALLAPSQFTVKALAKALSISAAWVYAQVDAGTIPHHRSGATIWFAHDELVVWLNGQRRPPANTR